MRALRCVGMVLALGALAGAALVYSGVSDVSATNQHLWPAYWTLRAAMERSIGVRARRVAVPALDAAERIGRGVGLYREHCAQPGTAMPDLHMRVRDANDIAAYLATLN